MSIDFVVGEVYSPQDMKELRKIHFFPSLSLWAKGNDVYLFRHTADKDKRFELEKIIKDKLKEEIPKVEDVMYTQFEYESDIYNCFSAARLGL